MNFTILGGNIIFSTIRVLCHLAIMFFMFVLSNALFSKKGVIINTDREYILNSLLNLVFAVTSVFLFRYTFEGHRQQTFKPLGLKFSLKALPDILFGFILSGILLGFLYVTGIVLGWIHTEKIVWKIMPLHNFIIRSFNWLVVFFLVSVWEELVARGYWLHTIRSGLNLKLGIIISSLLFAVSHLIISHTSWRTAMTIFAVGCLLAYSKIRTARLWLPIGLHMGWNFFMTTIFGFSVSGINKFSWIQNAISGPEWLLGGKFGLEDGLLILLVIPLGVVSVYLWTGGKRRK